MSDSLNGHAPRPAERVYCVCGHIWPCPGSLDAVLPQTTFDPSKGAETVVVEPHQSVPADVRKMLAERNEPDRSETP